MTRSETLAETMLLTERGAPAGRGKGRRLRLRFVALVVAIAVAMGLLVKVYAATKMVERAGSIPSARYCARNE